MNGYRDEQADKDHSLMYYETLIVGLVIQTDQYLLECSL